ncbi:MAG: HDOD domain-containing protein [Leptospiraceae bacterium]
MLPFDTHKERGDALRAVLSGELLTITFPGLVDREVNELSDFIYRLLSELDLAFLSEPTFVITKELLSNASKANAKRIYLHFENVDLSTETDYTRAMKGFANRVLEHWEDFRKQHKQNEYYTRLYFQLKEKHLHIEVRNNAPLLPREVERIQSRLELFKEHQELDAVFATVRDESEGAGLGLVLTLVLLQNAGVPGNHFRIDTTKEETIARVALPRDQEEAKNRNQYIKSVLDELDALPSFPENIQELWNLCNSESSSIQIITARVEKDPALTAQVLKLANSAGFMTRTRSPGLTDAIKIIGLKGLGNLLMVAGARKIMSSRYRKKDLESIWDNSNRVSFFAGKLARQDSFARDFASVSGLLYELGKIVLISMKPELIQKIQDMLERGRIRNTAMMEEVALGIGHPEVGAMLAERWQFPEAIVQAIRYQQKPLQAEEPYRRLIHCVYLAVRIQQAAGGTVDYFSIEEDIRKDFGIESPIQFQGLVERMEKEYEMSGGG